jgi:hypothetical protein
MHRRRRTSGIITHVARSGIWVTLLMIRPAAPSMFDRAALAQSFRLESA